MLTKHSHMLINMKTKEQFYHHKLKQKHSRMSCPSIFPTQNLNFWRFCVYVCMYRHIFHVSAHVAGDQTLASCLPQLLSTSFWDRISPWTWSSLTRQDQQASKPQIHLHVPQIQDYGLALHGHTWLLTRMLRLRQQAPYLSSPTSNPQMGSLWSPHTELCCLLLAYSCLFYSAQEEKFTVHFKQRCVSSGTFNNWS